MPGPADANAKRRARKPGKELYRQLRGMTCEQLWQVEVPRFVSGFGSDFVSGFTPVFVSVFVSSDLGVSVAGAVDAAGELVVAAYALLWNPGPLNTTPTGWSTRRKLPFAPQSQSFSASSVIRCSASKTFSHFLHS